MNANNSDVKDAVAVSAPLFFAARFAMWLIRLIWVCAAIMLVSVLLFLLSMDMPESTDGIIRSVFIFVYATLFTAVLVWADRRLYKWNKAHVLRTETKQALGMLIPFVALALLAAVAAAPASVAFFAGAALVIGCVVAAMIHGPVSPEATEKAGGKGTAIIGLTFLLIILCIMVRSVGTSISESIHPQDQTYMATGSDAWSQAKDLIRDFLKAPSQADFPWRDEARIVETAQDTWFIRSYVDSPNSYGVMIRTPFEAVMHYNKGTGWWECKRLTMDGVDVLP